MQKIRRHALLLIHSRLARAIDDKIRRTPRAVGLLVRPRSQSPDTLGAASEMFECKCFGRGVQKEAVGEVCYSKISSFLDREGLVVSHTA